MAIGIRRRQFVFALGGTAFAWPLAARAQQTNRMRIVGLLLAGPGESDSASQARLAAFRNALQELGWTEGRNVQFEVRWSGGNVDRARAFASELVTSAPDVVLAGGTTAIAILKQTTSSIPLVFVVVNDPVAQGFVSSVAHPGGNITGFSYMDFSMLGKALQLLKQLAPSMNRVGFMFNPDTYPYYESYLTSLRTQLHDLTLDLTPLRVRSEAEIKQAFEGLAGSPGTGLIAPPEPFLAAHHKLVVELAAQYRLSATYGLRDFVTDGGMMSYAPDQTDIFRRSASYIDRILKGEKPGDLPVQAPTKFELVINLNTAKALGLIVPPTLLASADEVIE
jgi:putative tryptophan/tyrosine transport system substrate-binding protein